MQQELQDARLDGLLDMLEAHHFQPTVNDLEHALMKLVESLGVHKEQLHVGEGPERVAYYMARLMEPGPDPWIKRVWRVQITGLMVLGAGMTAWVTLVMGHMAQLHIAISWFLLGIPFIFGMFLFERHQGRSWTSADLDSEEPPHQG